MHLKYDQTKPKQTVNLTWFQRIQRLPRCPV